MRVGRVVTTVLTVAFAAMTLMAPTVWSAPIQPGFEHMAPARNVQRITESDDCWWWGLRWQYGWRGYGWYPCWSEARPVAPAIVAPQALPPPLVVPEAVPPDDAVTADTCVQRWHDRDGHWHTRRIC